ncbi:MAG: potassium channel family protein [Patescibacteria group bacterium]
MFRYLFHSKLLGLYCLGASMIVLGVCIFMRLEGWTFIDALYFTVSTITTVGFGDITPAEPLSRLVATIYMLMSVPLVLIAVGLVVELVHDRIFDEIKSPSRRRRTPPRRGRRLARFHG